MGDLGGGRAVGGDGSDGLVDVGGRSSLDGGGKASSSDGGVTHFD